MQQGIYAFAAFNQCSARHTKQNIRSQKFHKKSPLYHYNTYIRSTTISTMHFSFSIFLSYFSTAQGGGIFVLIFTNFQLYIHIKSELQNLEKRYKFELHTKLYKGFFVELTYFTYLCIWLDVEKHLFSHLIGIADFCPGSEAKLRVGHLQPTQSYLLYH